MPRSSRWLPQGRRGGELDWDNVCRTNDYKVWVWNTWICVCLHLIRFRFSSPCVLKESEHISKNLNYSQQVLLLGSRCKFFVFVLSHSVVSQFFVTPWTVACQAPLSIGSLQARILEWCGFYTSSEPPGKPFLFLVL